MRHAEKPDLRPFSGPGVLTRWLALTAVLLAGGCAVGPQQVAIDPDVRLASRDLGQGRGIGIEVADLRPRREIGVRDPADATATISPAGEIEQALREILSRALAGYGFVPRQAASGLRFRLELTELSYIPLEGAVTKKVQVTAAVRGIASTAAGSYTATARAGFTRELLTRPSEADNEGMINEALGSALRRLLEDEGMLEFLARP
ncbi:MAG: hypothetical protein D6786_05890 [Gammaproteobacteria bacterium]|nr:MAG: hypothetical protein D6786_05890 [Gammaproteobacteria bacterium]